MTLALYAFSSLEPLKDFEPWRLVCATIALLLLIALVSPVVSLPCAFAVVATPLALLERELSFLERENTDFDLLVEAIFYLLYHVDYDCSPIIVHVGAVKLATVQIFNLVTTHTISPTSPIVGSVATTGTFIRELNREYLL
jgi:hypothetical protein